MNINSYKKIIALLNLTDEQKEAIYRIKQFEYVVENVKEHIGDMYDAESISREEELYAIEHVEELAERFINKYQDSSQAENDIYESMIHDFLRDRLKKFKVPVTWEMYGTVEVYAEDAEKANLYVQNNLDEFGLPLDKGYVDDSFRLSADNIEENIAMTEVFSHD